MVFLRIDAGRLRIVAAQSETLEQNKRRPRIVAAASKRGTRTRVRMISDDGSGVARTSPLLGHSRGTLRSLWGHPPQGILQPPRSVVRPYTIAKYKSLTANSRMMSI